MQAFMTYFSVEEADAEDLAEHLKSVFGKDGIEIFMASSWESVAPSDEWESKVIKAIQDAAVLLVLMSHDALSRPWINFEIGVAWATRTRILIFCHKGMTPSGLPRPYGSLQAVDLNGLTHEEKMARAAEAVSRALDLTLPVVREAAAVSEAVGPAPFASILRAWSLRPTSHVGEKANGRFWLGRYIPRGRSMPGPLASSLVRRLTCDSSRA